MSVLLLLFIVLPAVELTLLIELGRRIGTLETFAVIVLTGVLGASLARSQGLRVLAKVRAQLAVGEMPAESLLDGLMILIASALLVTPGVLTDAVGFLCLTPAFRGVVRREIVRRFKDAIERGRVEVGVGFERSARGFAAGRPGARSGQGSRPHTRNPAERPFEDLAADLTEDFARGNPSTDRVIDISPTDPRD